MKIAFYAPLKPPAHAHPSGDRRMARLLMRALGAAGFEVELASSFRSRDGTGDDARQRRLEHLGEALAARCVRRYRAMSPSQRPRLWFTYHLYHKAPDWLGPRVSAELGIPYVVAEASFAPRQSSGPWARGHAAVAAALARAALVFSPNATDDACVAPLLAGDARICPLAPFLDLSRQPAAPPRAEARARLAAAHRLDPDTTWIACAAMMRDDVKLASYRVLADALQRLRGTRWHLLVAGDGVARAEVVAAFRPLSGNRVHLLGECGPSQLATLWAGADVCAWPAIGEAFGMSLLEAQAAGVPVVAGQSAGVAGIVADGVSGLLVPAGDAVAFALALGTLIDDDALRARMARAARERVRTHHDLPGAAEILRANLVPLIDAPRHAGTRPS